MHDDYMCLNEDFEHAVIAVCPNYNPFGETEIYEEKWKQIGALVCKRDAISIEIYNELDEWLKNENVF